MKKDPDWLQFEQHVAGLFGTVRKKKDADLARESGLSIAAHQSDVEDHDTPMIIECKLRGFPAALEKHLAQALRYDPTKNPVVYSGEKIFGGGFNTRAYMDGDFYAAIYRELMELYKLVRRDA